MLTLACTYLMWAIAYLAQLHPLMGIFVLHYLLVCNLLTSVVSFAQCHARTLQTRNELALSAVWSFSLVLAVDGRWRDYLPLYILAEMDRLGLMFGASFLHQKERLSDTTTLGLRILCITLAYIAF